MSSDHSVSALILDLKSGEEAAAEGLWNRYFSRLVRYARTGLDRSTRRVSDEEDLAVSVFESFCRAARGGRFPDLADRESLWRLLIKMTARKAIDLRRHESRQCRGGGQTTLTQSESPTDEDDLLASVIGDEPTPEFAAMLAEEFQRLLSHLNDPELRRLALAKMEGFTNDELAEQMDCSLRTVERRLMLIREKCARGMTDE